LNAGYASLLLEAYLENPDAVPAEWQALFESGKYEELLEQLPGLARLLGNGGTNGRDEHEGNGALATVERRAEPQAPRELPVPAPQSDEILLGGVAAAMAL